jgi:hypothetical protein
MSQKDRYRKVRKALRKIKKFHMKGKVARQFVNKAKQSCFS